MTAMRTWLLVTLRACCTHLPLFIVFQIGVSAPITSQVLSNDEIIKTYFLPQSINSISDIEKSFQINNFNNVIAINWLKNINKATDEKDLARILPLIKNDLILPSTIPQPLRQVYLDTEEKIANTISNEVTLEGKRFEVAYFCAYFIHSYYLIQAQNGYLVLNPDYGRSLYINFAEGKIPKEFQEMNKEAFNNDSIVEFIPEDASSELTNLIRHLPFGHYGLIPIILLVISFLLRNIQPKSTPGEIEIASMDKIKDIIPSKDGKNPPKGLQNVAQNVESTFEVDRQPHELNFEHENKDTLQPPVVETIRNIDTIEKKPLYARAPHGNIFHQLEESPIPFLTQFKLTFNPLNENEIFFSFIENESDLMDLIQTNLRIFDEICEIISGKPITSPMDIKVLQPGKAIKEGEFWKIIKKITLQ